MKGYRGYVSVRQSGNIAIPSQAQNTMLRDYTGRKKILLKLPAVEYIYPGCYIILESIVDELHETDGIVMCSAAMLPKRRVRREAIYQKIFDAKAEIHFVMEAKIIAQPNDVEELEELFSIIQLLPFCPKYIPPYEKSDSSPCAVLPSQREYSFS